MITLNVYGEIGTENDKMFFECMGMPSKVFTVETLRSALQQYPDDPDLTINIDCPGGNVAEGLKIYDLLRTSGKNIYVNVEGACHSMAVVLLLAAPYANRAGNPNLRALIHNVYINASGMFDAEDLDVMKGRVQREQEAILDIYEDRTGLNRQFLASVMAEERHRTAEELLSWGFISKIISYNTNKHFSTMNKRKNPFRAILSNLSGTRARVNGNMVNYDFKDVDGNVVFRTDKEDDALAVGDQVEVLGENKSGIFTLEDGRIISVEDEVVTKIETLDASGEGTPENVLRAMAETISDLQNARERDNENIVNALNEFAETMNVIAESVNAIAKAGGSKYVPTNRKANPAAKGGRKDGVAELVNRAKEMRETFKEAGKIRK